MDYKKALKTVQNVPLKMLSRQVKEEEFKDIYVKIVGRNFNIKDDQNNCKKLSSKNTFYNAKL